ncbi:MAG TPA: branched-chain amino acid ABC transporter permease [Firmicutes bacterium]|nr:branched-chain amino acid ABC transporter permease [Bacillota bacterium]
MLQMVLQNSISGMAMGLLYGVIGIGVCLFWQTTGLINFAHISSAMLGAYFFYTFHVMWNLPIVIAFVLAVALVALYGILILRGVVYRQIMGRKGGRLEFIVATMMLNIFLLNLTIVLWGGVPYPFPNIFGSPMNPLRIGGITIQHHSLWVLGFTVALVIGLNYFFKRTLTGKALRATAQNKDTASLMGIGVEKMTALSFAMSTGVTAIAGILLAPIFFVSVELGGGIIGIKGFASAVIGGLTNPFGALVGGLLIGLTENFSVFYISSSYRDVITFVLLVFFLIARPQGLFKKM